jgi:DNA-binding NtrC family response regulator
MEKKIKVLVVDDEENVLKSVRKVILSKYKNFEIELSNTSFDGLEKLKNKTYNLVITDLMMPGMDGLELIKKIYAIDSQVKIIMITGYATMKTALLAMREGANKYISKPFTKVELLGAIDEVLTDTKENP